MTVTYHDFEEGTNAADVLSGINGVTSVSPAKPKYQTAAAFNGLLGVNTTSTSWWRYAVPASDWSGYVYFKPVVSPGTGNQRIIVFYNASNAILGGIRINAVSGTMQVVNAANILVGANFTTTWVVGDTFKLKWQYDYNSVASTVDISLRIFKNANIEGTTPDEIVTPRQLTSVTSAATEVMFGGLSTGTWSQSFDDVALSDQLEWIEPVTPEVTNVYYYNGTNWKPAYEHWL